jgi:DNA invertase Pin-like site-specific DNA recombinase
MNQPAIVYCRFSPRPLKKGDAERLAAELDLSSMQVQIDTNTRYCEFHKFTITELLKEPFTSARSVPLFERPEGSKLKNLPRGTNIVCSKLARMFRNVDDGRATIDYFQDRGIILHFSDEGGVSINTSTAKGKLVATMLLAVAEYEPEETAERTSRGMKHRQSNGELMCHRDNAPYGTRYDEQTGKLIEDQNELTAMKIAVKMRQHQESLRDIGYSIKHLVRGGDWSGHPQGVKDLLARAGELNIGA